MTYFILILYFLVLILIGVFFSRRQKDIADFFLAGRSIPAWAALAAIVATETSAITFIGTPAMTFAEGGDFSFLQFVFGYIVARVILAVFFLPKFFEHEIVTIYEYLGRRFGRPVQLTAGQFFFLTRALAAGVRHYAAALVLTGITGIDIITSILVTGIISVGYAFLGGLAAVIWTEVFQFGIMITGAGLALYTLCELIPGGFATILQQAMDQGKFTFIHWDWSSTGSFAFFGGIFGGTCLSLASHGADQDVVQRLLSCKSLRSAKAAIIGSGIFVFLQFAFFLLLGAALSTYYNGTLPQGLSKNDEILPYFITHSMSTVAGAVVIAAVLSAALSSTASALNSLSSTAVQDFVSVYYKTKPDNQTLVRLSRGFTLFWMGILILIAFCAKGSESILQTGLAIPSLTYGSLLAAFLLGIFTTIHNQRAIIAGMLGSTAIVVFCKLAGLMYPRLQQAMGFDLSWLQTLGAIPWTWYVPLGLVTSGLIAWVWTKTAKQ